jgi:hypothetical protein
VRASSARRATTWRCERGCPHRHNAGRWLILEDGRDPGLCPCGAGFVELGTGRRGRTEQRLLELEVVSR